MTFEQLKYFVEVCKYRSIAKTADNLFVSHQAVSKALHKIENEYSVELFIRSKNGMELTKAGQLLYKHGQNIINELVSFDENIKIYQPQSNTLPNCEISCAESLLHINGDKILDSLNIAFPHTYFNMSLLSTAHHFYGLPEADIYISFTDQCVYDLLKNTPLLAEYNSEILFSFPVYACFSEHSPLKSLTSLGMNDLRHYPFCNMSNTYNGDSYISFLQYYYPSYNPQNVTKIYTKKNFIDKLEKSNYYTLDLKLIDGNFFYYDMLKNYNIIYKKTDLIWHIFIFYRKSCRNFIQIIKNEIKQIFSPT